MYRLARAVGARVLDALAPSRCAACGDPGQPLCEACVAGLEATAAPLIGGVRAAFPYEGEVRQVLHHGKFRDCRSARAPLPGWARPGWLLRPARWWSRCRWRPGAWPSGGTTRRRWSPRRSPDFHRLAVAPLMARTRDTPAQSTLDRRARQASVAGAFSASGAAGRSIWLVDDVLTTGATTRAATDALLEAGARRVDVAVLAAVV